MICYFNGDYIEESDIAISPIDRGFTLGDGVFDTMLVLNKEMQYAEAHFARLQKDAAIIDIHPNMNFPTAAAKLLQLNPLHSLRHVIRTQITRGIGQRGLAPSSQSSHSILMRIMEVPEPYLDPAKAMIATRVRRNEFSPLSKIKSLNYGDNIIALMEAKSKGADDAILLNTKGFVACASASNIFIREGEIWTTPPLSDGVLAGITRGVLINELRASEESITPERLARADEIFQCNSIIGRRKIFMQR